MEGVLLVSIHIETTGRFCLILVHFFFWEDVYKVDELEKLKRGLRLKVRDFASDHVCAKFE